MFAGAQTGTADPSLRGLALRNRAQEKAGPLRSGCALRAS